MTVDLTELLHRKISHIKAEKPEGNQGNKLALEKSKVGLVPRLRGTRGTNCPLMYITSLGVPHRLKMI